MSSKNSNKRSLLDSLDTAFGVKKQKDSKKNVKATNTIAASSTSGIGSINKSSKGSSNHHNVHYAFDSTLGKDVLKNTFTGDKEVPKKKDIGEQPKKRKHISSANPTSTVGLGRPPTHTGPPSLRDPLYGPLDLIFIQRAFKNLEVNMGPDDEKVERTFTTKSQGFQQYIHDTLLPKYKANCDELIASKIRSKAVQLRNTLKERSEKSLVQAVVQKPRLSKTNRKRSGLLQLPDNMSYEGAKMMTSFWLSYMKELLCLQYSNAEQLLLEKLHRAVYTGCMISVNQSSNIGLIRKSGIVIRESKKAFTIVDQTDRVMSEYAA